MPLPLLLIPAAAAATTTTGVSIGTLVGAIIGSIAGGISVGAASIAAFFYFKKDDAKGDTKTKTTHQESLLRQQTRIKGRQQAAVDSLNAAQSAVRSVAHEVLETATSILSTVAHFRDEERALDGSSEALLSSVKLAGSAAPQMQEPSESWIQMQESLRTSTKSTSGFTVVLSDTQGALGATEQDIQQLNDTLAAQAIVVGRLSETIQTLNEKSNGLEAQKGLLLERNEALEQECLALLSQRDAVQSALAQAFEKYSQIKARYTEVLSQNAALKQALLQKQGEIDGLVSAQNLAPNALGLYRRGAESSVQAAPNATPSTRFSH